LGTNIGKKALSKALGNVSSNLGGVTKKEVLNLASGERIVGAKVTSDNFFLTSVQFMIVNWSWLESIE
jgi:hypothetical protein